MPAIMMMPASGVPDRVTGSSSARAEVGPMPGSTPTRVPMKTPLKQKSRLTGCSTTAKPWLSPAITSMEVLAEDAGQDACRQPDLEPLGERGPYAERGYDGNDQRQAPVDGIDEPHEDEEQRQRADDESDRLESHAVDEKQRDDHQH